MNFIFKCLIAVLCVLGKVKSGRNDVHEVMYKTLHTTAACFRRLNGTHQFGCSSERGGSLGIINIIKNNSDLTFFLKNAVNDDYMVVLYMNMFTSEVMDQLIKHDNIAGVLVILERYKYPDYFSPDDICPNSLFNSCSGKAFNPLGNKFLFMDWPFPMFLLEEKNSTAAINKCYNQFNIPFEDAQLSRPLCSLQMKSHMSAAVNSPTCIRRASQAGVNIVKYCDPMGDQNIILPMGVYEEEVPSRSVIVIAARLDAASLFDGIAPGAVTSATGIVTLLMTAHILSKVMKTQEDNGKTILFLLLNGEVHDYIGSSRTVYDMEKGDFVTLTSLNISLENIMTFIEISQVDSNPNIFLHSNDAKKIYNFEEELMKAGSSHSLNVKTSSRKDLPPSSLQVFSKADPLLHGIIISNFDQEFTNPYFNGLLDNAHGIHYEYAEPGTLHTNIAALSATIASAVFSIISGKPQSFPSEPYAEAVNDLFHCFLITRKCQLMKEVYSGNEETYFPVIHFPLYVGVQPSPNPMTTTTGLLLAYLTSDHLELTKENCSMGSNQKAYSYFWVYGPHKTGICLNTTLKFTPAVSPAFLIPDYDWTSGNYSTWTESIWIDFHVEMYLKPSRKQELITLSTGFIVLFSSLFSVYWIYKHSQSMLFQPSPTNC